jgi:hypothetical protein
VQEENKFGSPLLLLERYIVFSENFLHKSPNSLYNIEGIYYYKEFLKKPVETRLMRPSVN